MRKADFLVREQAILRNKEREARQKREIKLPQGPGSTSVGSIHDCNRDHFERLLRAYWDKLYVGWNPYKNEGRGCWEVWQYPLKKTPVLRYHNEQTGEKIFTLEYKTNDFEHWVADLDYLAYDFIEKLRKMDSWANKHQVAEHEYEYERWQQKMYDAEDENIEYVVKHNKKAFRDLLTHAQNGVDPLQFFYKSIK